MSLSNLQYIDIQWLTHFGLYRGNVLDYFYTSPFFDTKSNNQLLRIQGVESRLSMDHLSSMIGLEYVLDDQNIHEPHLYVIRKQNRESLKKYELLDIFYCLDGIIYQSPDMLELIRSRITKISLYLKRSFISLQSTTEYTSKKRKLCVQRLVLSNDDNADDDADRDSSNSKSRSNYEILLENNDINVIEEGNNPIEKEEDHSLNKVRESSESYTMIAAATKKDDIIKTMNIREFPSFGVIIDDIKNNLQSF